jgi:hypothetical protein
MHGISTPDSTTAFALSLGLLLAAAFLGCGESVRTTAGGDTATPGSSQTVLCPDPGDNAEPVEEAKLYFEHNSTDEDTGFHGLIGQDGWSRLCVYDPSGVQILGIQPSGSLGALGMADIFFESREPGHSEVEVVDHFEAFPEGMYTVRGVTYEGGSLTGEAWVTHDVPRGAVITHPPAAALIPPTGLVITWEPVTETINGDAAEITAYEVIVTNDEVEDPHGWAQPIYDVHIPAGVTSLSVPDEFLEAGTVYEIEVLAIEVSGNQTISAVFFTTEEQGEDR